MPNVNCCVPFCVASTKRTPSLSFHKLPKEQKRRKLWMKLIKNEELRKESQWTSVCSLHFSGGQKTYMIKDPSVFPWSSEWPQVIEKYNSEIESATWELNSSSSGSRRVKPLPLNVPKHSKAERVKKKSGREPPKRRECEPKATSSCEAPQRLESSSSISYERSAEEAVDDFNGSEHMDQCQNPNRSYYRNTHLLLKDDLNDLLDKIMAELVKEDSLNDVALLKNYLKITIQLLKNIKEETDIMVELRDWDRFLLRRFEGSDEDIRFWTGFYSHAALMAFYMNLLEPNVNNIKHWGAVYADEKDTVHKKCGPKRKLLPVDEMFLTLVKLKQGSANQDIAERFKISDRHVSRIFTTWVKFMHGALMSINCWMSRGKISKYMPLCFKELYKDVRVIIDCTEIPLQRPSDFECQSATYSNYKHCNTLKGLVGISPSGVPTFVSPLYEGNISDNQLVFQCGLIKQCEAGDVILADRGFTCKEAMAKHGIRLVVPHFLGGKEQLDLVQITDSVAIARVRIHVERAMGRIKQWHILSRTLPVVYWNCANEIFQLCTKLLLFWEPLVGSE